MFVQQVVSTEDMGSEKMKTNAVGNLIEYDHHIAEVLDGEDGGKHLALPSVSFV